MTFFNYCVENRKYRSDNKTLADAGGGRHPAHAHYNGGVGLPMGVFFMSQTLNFHIFPLASLEINFITKF